MVSQAPFLNLRSYIYLNTFISNEGFTRTNSLTPLLENDNDRGDFGKIEISPYIDIEALGENIYESRSKLSVLSLNIQSINAKFDEFKIALDQLNSKQPINTICIQETWVDSTTDTCAYQLSLKGNIVQAMVAYSRTYIMISSVK